MTINEAAYDAADPATGESVTVSGGATAANQDQVEGYVDGLESVLGTTADAATSSAQNGSLSAKLRGLLATEEAIAGSVGNLDTVRGYVALSAVEITRPADTTAYAAKDAISNSTSAPTILTFTGCARTAGQGGYVTKARLQTDQAANVSAYRLHLYNATLSAVNDNAAQTVLYANRASYLGYIDFPAASTDGSDTANSLSTQAVFPYVTSGSTSLFGMLETITGFTPASGQKFYVQLTCDQN